MDNSEQHKKQEREKKRKKYMWVNKCIIPLIIIMELFICGCLVVAWLTDGSFKIDFLFISGVSLAIFLLAGLLHRIHAYLYDTYLNDNVQLQLAIFSLITSICVPFFFLTVLDSVINGY